MKAFANWVMKGRMQAVIAATVLAVLALLITPLALLSAAVIMLTAFRQGGQEGALVVGSALLAIAGLGGLLFQMPIAIALIGAALWLPAAALGSVLGRTGSLRVAIEMAAIGAALIVVLQYLLISDPAAYWEEMLTDPLPRSMSFCSCLRSLSLAVTDATRAPWRENSLMIDGTRSSSGPVITTGSPVLRSR